jgi:predicted oxidoreductase
MKRLRLAPDGPEVSRLAYGVWRLGDDPEGADVARIRAKMDVCLENGITTFDHADIYGLYTCEGLFGRALAEAPELRGGMEIITKCGINVPCENRPGVRVAHYDATTAAIQRCVDRSLRELHTDYVDVLLIHRPDWLTSAEETARGLERVVEAGKVRHVGVSNYSVHQFALLAGFLRRPLVTNQVEVNLLHTDAIYDGTLDQCQGRGAHPMAWSPLAGGRLMTGDGEAAVRTRSALMRIAAEYGVSAEALALVWVAALPSQPQVVIGTNRLERIREAAASERITLDRQHWYELWEAAKGRKIP